MTADDTVQALAEARLAAIRRVHRPEKRWHDGSSEWSVDTPEETDVDDPEYFEVCRHCGHLEVNDQAPDVQYRDSMWPCPTIRELDAAPITVTDLREQGCNRPRDLLPLLAERDAARAEVKRLQTDLDGAKAWRNRAADWEATAGRYQADLAAERQRLDQVRAFLTARTKSTDDMVRLTAVSALLILDAAPADETEVSDA